MSDVINRIAFWTCLIAIAVLALIPSTQPLPTTGWDKTNHLFGFATLAFLGNWAYPSRKWTLLLGLLAYGGLIEFLQWFTPDRQAEWSDLLADALGLLIGSLVALLVFLRRTKQ